MANLFDTLVICGHNGKSVICNKTSALRSEVCSASGQVFFDGEERLVAVKCIISTTVLIIDVLVGSQGAYYVVEQLALAGIVICKTPVTSNDLFVGVSEVVTVMLGKCC